MIHKYISKYSSSVDDKLKSNLLSVFKKIFNDDSKLSDFLDKLEIDKLTLIGAYEDHSYSISKRNSINASNSSQ